jgi:hypothetical protein
MIAIFGADGGSGNGQRRLLVLSRLPTARPGRFQQILKPLRPAALEMEKRADRLCRTAAEGWSRSLILILLLWNGEFWPCIFYLAPPGRRRELMV